MTHLTPLALVAKEAGNVVLSMQDVIVLNKNGEIEHKPDGSIITPADLKAHEIILALLREQFPNLAVVSEESSEEERIAASQYDERFEMDPIDNTGGYAKGRDGFSVNLGRIEGSKPVEGVVYFPARRELYFTGEDRKAYLQKGNETPEQISVQKSPRMPLKVVTGFSEQHLEHVSGFEFEVEQKPAQLRTCGVATGEYDVTGINKGRGGYNSWDVAGPHAVLKAAGGEFITIDGKLLEYPVGNLKLPDHIGGARETLKSIGFALPET